MAFVPSNLVVDGWFGSVPPDPIIMFPILAILRGIPHRQINTKQTHKNQ